MVSDCIVTANMAAEIIGLLDLQPHLENGHYRDTSRYTATDETAGTLSTLIFLVCN